MKALLLDDPGASQEMCLRYKAIAFDFVTGRNQDEKALRRVAVAALCGSMRLFIWLRAGIGIGPLKVLNSLGAGALLLHLLISFALFQKDFAALAKPPALVNPLPEPKEDRKHREPVTRE